MGTNQEQNATDKGPRPVPVPNTKNKKHNDDFALHEVMSSVKR